MAAHRIVWCAAFLASGAGVIHAQVAKTTAPITVSDLRFRASVLADDSTRGRETGSVGDDMAARYIAAEFARLGLEPAGEGGTFFQTVPMEVRAIDWTATTLRMSAATLRPRRDYLPLPSRGNLPWSPTRELRRTETVFGGTIADSTHWIDSATANGRLVVLRVPTALGSRAGFVLNAGIPGRFAGAAGIALVALDVTPTNYVEFLSQPVMRLAAPGTGATDPADMPSLLLLSNNIAQRMFGAAIDSLAVGQFGTRVGGGMAFKRGPTEAPARNVVAILRGSDAARRETYVSISAHHDHVGVAPRAEDHDSLRAYMHAYERFRQASPTLVVTPAQAASIHVNVDSLRRVRPARRDSIFNGADDDISGTIAMLEIAEQFASMNRPRPKRSILFLAHTGEERGLLGSGWYSTHPTVPIDSIVAEIDMDMVGRGAAPDLEGGGDDYLELIGSRRQSTAFGDLIDTLNAKRARPFRINYAYDAHDHPEGDWCRADHYSYARFGIPAAAFSTSYHGDYHQVTDEAEYLDYPHLASIAGFVGDIAATVANLDQRPVLDKPKPANPFARCVQ
ncbi:MAG: peptidase [Candidatus Eremiobacteraeota bacterium]|nr:peptidase [Candidatus Eremiobacteraeota bacterium]